MPTTAITITYRTESKTREGRPGRAGASSSATAGTAAGAIAFRTLTVNGWKQTPQAGRERGLVGPQRGQTLSPETVVASHHPFRHRGRLSLREEDHQPEAGDDEQDDQPDHHRDADQHDLQQQHEHALHRARRPRSDALLRGNRRRTARDGGCRGRSVQRRRADPAHALRGWVRLAAAGTYETGRGAH